MKKLLFGIINEFKRVGVSILALVSSLICLLIYPIAIPIALFYKYAIKPFHLRDWYRFYFGRSLKREIPQNWILWKLSHAQKKRSKRETSLEERNYRRVLYRVLKRNRANYPKKLKN